MSVSWPTIRKRALERDDYTCQDCGAPVGRRSNPNLKDAEVHHETPRSEGGSDNLENLVTLCVDCHTERRPPAEGRDGRGQYTETYPSEAFTDAVRDVDGLAGTQTVADAVGCSYELAYKRLRALEDAGEVNCEKVANARVWRVVDDE